ncbi:MAG: lysophospholipid acyltransferase family protein [Pseudomonadota bacterium]
MQTKSGVARDISYASSARSRAGRALIRVTENVTGRMRLIRQAAGYEVEVAKGRNFWDVMADRYGLSLDVTGGALDNIPVDGPLIVIANHPFGILDGLMIGKILSHRRDEYRILANQVFRKAKDLEKIILPVSFEGDKDAVALNVATRRESLRFLGEGGAIGIFPGGTVSTAARPFGYPMDPGWRSFTARMIAKSQATIVPVFFEGHNSRLFQIASHVHATLRMALLIKEFKSKVGEPVPVVIGAPIQRSELDPYVGDPKAMMDFLREATYRLSPRPLPDYGYGYEFEQKHKS